jgi:hypothetical protein
MTDSTPPPAALEALTPAAVDVEFEALFWSWLRSDDVDAAWLLWLTVCDYPEGGTR